MSAATISIITGLPLALIGSIENHKMLYGYARTSPVESSTVIDFSRSRYQQQDALRSASKEQSLKAYGQLPLAFEANQGQSDEQVRFLARGSGYGLYLTSTEAILSLRPPATQSRKAIARAPKTALSKPGRAALLRLKFVGANAAPQMLGAEELPGKVNYLIGNDPAKWRTNISTYARVKYQNIYPGVDLVYYGNQRHLEYDLIVAPGADPSNIAMRFEGNKALVLDGQGNLTLKMTGGTVVLNKPVIYQEINGTRQEIMGSYTLQGTQQAGFRVGDYDSSKPLIIDPVLAYSTYLGGSGGDTGEGIAVDSTGNAYITGDTSSSSLFPLTTGALQSTYGGNLYDAYVTKLNASGNSALYSTYLGGSGDDRGFAIAVDSAGNACVTGRTSSTNFPGTNSATFGGMFDAFVTRLNATGNSLISSIYLGGTSFEQGVGIALDSFGNAYVTGETQSTDFDIVSIAYQANLKGGSDAFVTRVGVAGVLYYSTYLGDTNADLGQKIAVDSSGNAYVAGYTFSHNFPTTAGAYQTTFGGGQVDVFVTKLNTTGTSLDYSTFLGGSNSEISGGIAVDSAKNAYVSGSTQSSNFDITTGAVQAAFGGGAYDAFVTKLNATGSALVYSTYLGGSGVDGGGGIAIDSAGNAYVTGSTSSIDFPMMNPYQNNLNGAGDAFVTELSPTGNPLLFSTYFGGSSGDGGNDIAVDSAGNIYVTGSTNSTDFPKKNPYQSNLNGAGDAFVTKFEPQPPCVGPPNTAMIAWYPFDETSGTTAANLATENTGTLFNSPTHIPGKVGWALRFDGIDDYIDSPSTIVTNIGPADLPQTCSGAYSTCRGDFSIDAWLYVDPTASLGSITIVDKRSSTTTTTTGYYFYVYQRNTLGLMLADGVGGAAYTSPVITGLAGSWHHVAVTVSRRSTSGIKWYDNGVNIGSSDPTATGLSVYGSLANNSPLRIGSRTAATALQGWFKGSMDELEIFNRVLTPQEILAIFNSGTSGKCKP